MKPETLCRTAAALAFAAVALGAFGAHALRARLETGGFSEVWRTAVFYHLTHAIALFALALFQQASGRGKEAPRAVAWLMLLGILVFSGSLYALALTGVRWLGAITPLGGLCLLAAWGWLAVSGLKGTSAKASSVP
jgi:uncharacterized membrane protein YgdD (TMEM256/DUF423 family)